MTKRNELVGEPHPLFDEPWYLAQLSEPLAESPLAHYRRVGATRGLSPHPLFDASFYLAQLEQPLSQGENPLEHYLTVGAARGLSPHPLFNARWYHQQQRPPQSRAPKHDVRPPGEWRAEARPSAHDDDHEETKRAIVARWSAGRVERALPLSSEQRKALETLQRKGRKLARNPEAFFADSRSPLVRVLGKLLVKGPAGSRAPR